MTEYSEATSLLSHMRSLPDKSYLIFYSAGIRQMVFFRDRIVPMFQERHDKETDEEYEAFNHQCKVRGFHMSKSVQLPVYWFQNSGIEIIARNNFFNWNVSIRSPRGISLPDYFKINQSYDYLFLEGMEDCKFPPYASGIPCSLFAQVMTMSCSPSCGA